MDRMTPSFAPSSLGSPFARRLTCRGHRLGFAEMMLGWRRLAPQVDWPRCVAKQT
jgi:hypothetical protein